jgi:hypothetical protein
LNSLPSKEDKRMRQMSVLFYSSKKTVAVEDLKEFVGTLSSDELLEVCRSCEELIHRFHEPGKNPTITVLCAADADELNAIISLADLFTNTQLVLILPDRGLVTVGKALSIGPRFITYADGRTDDTKAVLGKMLIRISHNSETLTNKVHG